MAVKPIPDRYHTITPYLIVNDVPELIRFLQATFGATEIERVNDGEGRVMHAEVRVGNSVVMMGTATDKHPPFPAMLYVYVDDTDAAYRAGIAAGATSVMEPADQFYGDRSAGVKDTNGNVWWIGTHVEDVDAAELAKRAAEREKT